MKKTNLFALLAVTLFTFISCENFLKGEDVKNEIVNVIEYNNAPSYPINVELFNDSDGKIKTPATGEVTKKVTDEFTIRFEPAADHVFVKWEAIVKDLSKGEVPSDYIQFDDAESTETTVTFKKASNKVIIIRPVCPPRLSYTMYQTERGVLPRDSSVELTFNQEVATDLSSSAADYISITGDTIDVDEHFKSPEVKGKKLIFKADTTTDGYIPIENNNQRGITVRIPKEKIWYINKDYTEPVKVYLDADIKETYFINSETSSKTEFKYKLLQDKNENDLGILKIDEKENDNEKQYAYSVGQQFALKYRIPEGYSFQKWNFYNNKNELLDPDLLSLEFSEEEYTNDFVQVKITVTNYIPDTLTITPIIHETLKVTSFNLGDSYKTYERDSDIILGFNKDLAPECIDNIIIQIPGLPEGKTVDDYFEPAVINEKTYTRKAKKIAAAKLIPLGLDGTNTITISMAASDVYYVETLSDGTTANVGFDADTVLSYKINAETINKIKIKFFVEDDYSTTGEYKIDGIVASGLVQDLTPGKSVKLRFKLTSDDYYFKGWRVTRSYNEAGVAKEDSYEQGSFNNDNLAEIGLSVAYDDNENEFGYEALTKIAQATITVDEYKEGTFAISPVIVPIPTANVIIDGSNGKFSPAKGTYRIKEKIFENLSFDPDGDYEFIRWQIYNETTGEEYNNADYITINDLKAERTSYAVVRVPEEKDSEGNNIKLAIRPVVTERPQILSYSPMYSAAGALRDTTIQVLFDYDMSVYSIYYTENELDSLRHTLMIDDDKDESETVTGNKLLSVMRNGVKNYYGYKTNGTTYLKNLSIKNNRTGENLNGCYKEPVFETARSLSLKVSETLPPEYTQISISIERGFFYEMEGKTISMSGAKKWIYQVGAEYDSAGPAVEKATIKYYTGKDALDNDTYKTLVALHTVTQGEAPNQTKEIVYDTEFNPNPNYTKPSINQTTFSGIEDLIYIAEKTYPDEDGDGEEEKKVELSVDFTVNDNNATSSAFNVFYNKIYDSNYDLVESENGVRSFGVYYDSTMGSIGQYKNNIDLSFLDDGIYAIWFTFPDAARWTTIYPALSDDQNPAVDYIPKNKFYVAIDRTAPQVVSTEISDYNAPKWLKLSWDYALGYCPDIKEIFVEFNGDDAQVYTPFESFDDSLALYGSSVKTAKSCTKNGLIGGKHYSVDITFKDWAGNSVTCNLDETTIPSAPTSVTMPEGYGTDIKIEYTMPDTDFSGTRIRYREKGATKWLPEVAETDKDGNLTGAYVEAPIENTTKETSLEAYVENLDYGKQYEFEICSYDLASGKESPVYKVSSALPMHVTRPADISFTNILLSNSTDNGVVYCKTPASAFSGIKVIYSVNEDFSDAVTYTVPNSSSSYLGTNTSKSVQLNSGTSGALTPGTLYYVKFVAWYNTTDNYVESDVRTSYTKTAPARNLRVNVRTNNSIRVYWAKALGNCSKYKIEYKEVSATNWESANITVTNPSTSTYYYTINSYNNNPLVGGKYYNIRLTAQSYNDSDTIDNGSTGWRTRANPVTNISAKKQSSTSIKVSWTNPTGSYDYIRIFKAESESDLSDATEITPNYSTYHTFTGLTQGKEYYFKIVSYITDSSSGTIFTTSSEILQCSTDIDPVSNQSAVVDSATQITLRWTNPDSASYDGVQVSSNNGSSWTSVSGKTTTSYSYTSLSPNTSYTFKIRTYKTVGSETKYAAVDAGTVCTLASPVTGLSNPVHTSTYVKLKWINPASTSYEKIEIYAGTSKAGEITDKTTNEFTVQNLTSGTRPTFYVKTINKDGVANSISSTYYVSLDTAKNLTVSSTTTTGATVTWTKPAGNYTYLYVYYKKSSDSSWSNSGALSSSTTSYTIGSSTALTVATKYDVKVVTYMSSWTDQETTPISFYTKPNAPTNLRVSSRTTTSITYSWTAPTGNFGRYDLMWKKVGSSVNSTYISTDKTSYTIYNLSAGEQYEAYLRVCPVDDTTTMNLNAAATTSTIKNYTRPNAPTGLSAAYENGNVKLTWTKPTGSQNYYYVLYRKTGSTGSWSGNFIGGTYNSYTFENLHDYNDYDFKVQSNCYNSSAGEDIYSDDSTTVTKRTPPPAVSSASLYTDDGMGNIQVKYTFPSFTSTNMEVDFYVNGTYINCVNRSSYVSGGTGYKLVPIPSYTRGTTYTIGVKTYVYNNGWIAGPMKTFTVTNSTGDIKLAGTEYSYTRLKNVISSNTTVNKNTGGSFTANNSITLTPYSIGAYEVTQELFEAVMGTNPSTNTGSKYYPATNFTWYAAIAFCNKLSAMMGLDPCYTVGTISNSDWKDFSYSSIPTVNDDNWNKATCDFTKNGYHIPTEYQWEFAARGGSTTAADWSYKYAGENTYGDVAWYSGNSSGSLHDVGKKAYNGLGLYDMNGNVWELTNDFGASTPPAVTATDFTVNYTSSYRTSNNIVYKGGAYCSGEYTLSTRLINCLPTRISGYDVGLRICRNRTY